MSKTGEIRVIDIRRLSARYTRSVSGAKNNASPYEMAVVCF